MRTVLTALLALLLLAAPAAGQKQTTVARHGDIQLTARVSASDGQDELCATIRAERAVISSGCGPAPKGRLDAMILSAWQASRGYVGGAVPAAGTHAVELEYADGTRVPAGTIRAEGFDGRFAFFLAERTGAEPDEDPVLLRRFDANGRLIGAAPGGHESPRVAGPLTLVRRRGLRIAAVAQRFFAPSVIQLDRRERHVCLTLNSPREESDGISCARTGPFLPPLTVQARPRCGPLGTLVHGFAGPQVTHVELTLGSGRRMRLPTRDVSSLGTASRAVAGLAPAGEAVRSARALDAAGRTIERQTLAAAPMPRRCAPSNGILGLIVLFSFLTGESTVDGPTDGQQVAAGAPPSAQLVVRDEGDHLCMGIDGLAADKRDCIVPSPEMPGPHQFVDRTDERTAIGGLVEPDAATVRIEFDGRDQVVATISDGGAYTGRYRGHVRFFLAEAPGRRKVTQVETLDARGRLITSYPGPDASEGRSHTVARGRGYRVFTRSYDYRYVIDGERPQRERGSCVGIAVRGERPDPPYAGGCSYLGAGMTAGWVSCSLRRGVLVVRLGRHTTGIRLALAGGRTIDSRRVAGTNLAVLEIPSGARVARLRRLGRRRAEPFFVPPPKRQCGYALPDPTF